MAVILSAMSLPFIARPACSTDDSKLRHLTSDSTLKTSLLHEMRSTIWRVKLRLLQSTPTALLDEVFVFEFL